MTRTTQTTRSTETTGRPHRPCEARFTALVTPFTTDGALDEAAFGRLLDHQLDGGIDGLVPCGTTGESPTLTTDERERVIGLTIEAVARPRSWPARPSSWRAPARTTREATIAATRRAATLGADAALVVAPYYNKPDQRMLEAHYRAVADEGDLPDRRLQRARSHGHERRRRHAPASRRASRASSRSRRPPRTSSRS